MTEEEIDQAVRQATSRLEVWLGVAQLNMRAAKREGCLQGDWLGLAMTLAVCKQDEPARTASRQELVRSLGMIVSPDTDNESTDN